MKQRKGLQLTLEQADAHQRKHGFKPLIERDHDVRDKGVSARPTATLRGKAKEMNKTEREFSLMLEAQKCCNEILDWRFAGVRLRWGDCMIYTPDFTVMLPLSAGSISRIKLIEIKGARIIYHQQAVARFKGCRAEWKEFFDFELWQKDASKQWNRLL